MSIDRTEITAGIFLNLFEAIDTLDHQISFSETWILWHSRYIAAMGQTLFDKSHTICPVLWNPFLRSDNKMRSLVNQGSTLGSLFFIFLRKWSPKRH